MNSLGRQEIGEEERRITESTRYECSQQREKEKKRMGERRIRAGGTQKEGKQREAEGRHWGARKGRRDTVATQEKGSREAEGRHGWRQ